MWSVGLFLSLASLSDLQDSVWMTVTGGQTSTFITSSRVSPSAVSTDLKALHLDDGLRRVVEEAAMDN